jgi:arylsulfatase A-like enzyme
VLLFSRSECGLVRDGYKLVAAPRAGTLALYDLAADPGELRNLAGRDATRARDLLRELDGLGCPAGELAGLALP